MIERESPWRRSGVMFGRMFEDWDVEANVFPDQSNVFCIASAGCTALGLASLGHHVTAVDINPAQVALVRARLTGADAPAGSVDRMLARARRIGGALGWTEATLRAFLSLADTTEQQSFWRARLDTRRFRMALAALLSPLTLHLLYPAPLADAVPRGFANILRQRFDRGFSTHPNRTNPYARWLLLGDRTSAPAAPGAVTVLQADAAEYLENCPAHTFGAFTLSNITDGASAPYVARLDAAVERAAQPGAVVVLRSFAEPQSPEEDAWASRDRALLWGRIRIAGSRQAGTRFRHRRISTTSPEERGAPGAAPHAESEAGWAS
jgi:S-adenosylmethionine:diacylglycerol 3-amino-3-carboxypropyl transferase